WIWSLMSPATFFFFGGIVFLILRLDFGAALYTRWADFSCAPVPLPWPRGRTCGDTGATLESLRATGVQSQSDRSAHRADRQTSSPPAQAAERARRAGSARQSIFSTCVKPNSTGVSRPKIETSTLSFCAAASTSEILAGSVANGPSMTVTDSPTSNSASTAGAAMPPSPSAPAPAAAFFSGLGARNLATSLSESGVGVPAAPPVALTNPVTPGVLRTTPHD